jgi:hypothetical protein
VTSRRSDGILKKRPEIFNWSEIGRISWPFLSGDEIAPVIAKKLLSVVGFVSTGSILHEQKGFVAHQTSNFLQHMRKNFSHKKTIVKSGF